MGIYSKPQRTRDRQNGIIHAREVQEQAHRHPRLSSARMERLSEWTQNASGKNQPLASVEGLPLAFIFADLTFLGSDRTTIPQ